MTILSSFVALLHFRRGFDQLLILPLQMFCSVNWIFTVYVTVILRIIYVYISVVERILKMLPQDSHPLAHLMKHLPRCCSKGTLQM